MPIDFENPPFLYRYRALTPDPKETARDVVRDELNLIAQGFIWTSHPADMNDPFDCRPICSPEQRTKLDQLLGRFFIGSMSALPPNEIEASPMWSHYADNHAGICIEFPFERSREALRKPIERVRYSNARFDLRGLDPARMRITSPQKIGVLVPREEISDPANNIDVLELTRKSDAWRYEQEWRYIWPQNYTNSPEVIARDQTAHGPRAEHMVFIEKPSRVILGARMDSKRKNTLKTALDSLGIKVVTACLSDTEYRLSLS